MFTVRLKNRVNNVEWDNPELAQQVFERVKECFDKLNAITGLSVKVPDIDPVVYFNKSTLGGYVWPRKYGDRVFLNWVLLKENQEDFFVNTIPHEVCHIFQFKVNPFDKSHGKTWKGLMVKMGLNPTRCHNYDTQNAGRKRNLFRYVCNCRKYTVSARSHNRVLNGASFTPCNICHSKIVFLNKIEEAMLTL